MFQFKDDVAIESFLLGTDGFAAFIFILGVMSQQVDQ